MAKKKCKQVTNWAALWHANSKRFGKTEHILREKGVVKLFETRREARAWIDLRYGYIRTREDLRAEPHGFRMPKAVKVEIRRID